MPHTTSAAFDPATGSGLDSDRWWVRAARFIIGVFVLAGVAYSTSVAVIDRNDRGLVEQFSFFTIEANLVFGAVLVLSAVLPRQRLPRWWDHLRGALTFYLVMTGLVYALLVAPPGEVWSLNITWTNWALHRVAPLFAVADWLLVVMTIRGRWMRPLVWLIYPLAFLIYSWIRGAITGWYPYDFLNPTLPGGWGAVLVTTLIVLIAFLIVSVIVHLLGNLRAGSPPPPGSHR